MVNDDGLLDVGAINNPDFAPATLDVTQLLEQLGLDAVTDGVIDELALEIGALGANTTSTENVATSEYDIANLKLNLHSETVAGLATSLGAAVQGTTGTVSDLVGAGGALESLAQSIVGVLDGLNVIVANVNASVGDLGIDGLDTVGSTVTAELMETDLQNQTGSVFVSLDDGTIAVDLAKILAEANAGEDLNEFGPNTEVLNAETIAAIQQGVTDALTGTHADSLLSKTSSILMSTINALEVTIQVDLDLRVVIVGSVAKGDITVSGTLAQFAGTATPLPTVTPNITLLGLDLSLLTAPVVTLLTDTIATVTGPLVQAAIDDVVPNVQPALAGLTTPLLGLLSPALDVVTRNVLSVRINEQPTEMSMPQEGDLGAGSFTVRALTATVLPLIDDAVKIDIASATVRSAEAVEATLTATPNPVEQGQVVTFGGAGYDPDETVSITGRDGMTITVTADVDGEIAGTWMVPADFPIGAITFTAAGDTSGKTATADSVVAQGADAGADADVNASASASASANADDDSNASAQVAAQAAALADASTTAEAASSADATAAAAAAANTDASTTASADVSTDVNASAQTAAQASAQASADATVDAASAADASAAADANAASASEAAADADASAAASVDAAADVDVAADVDATADADADVDVAADVDVDASANQEADAAADSTTEADPAAQSEAKASTDAQGAASGETASANADAATSGGSEPATADANARTSARNGNLAATGSDLAGLYSVGGILMVLGAGLVIARRVRAGRQ